MDSTKYYDKNAQAFYNRTIVGDLQEIYNKFLRRIPERSRILDAGCGVGRDSKFLSELGHDVVSFDGSQEMVKMASQHLGRPVQQMLFQEIDFVNCFDAVWANASLLHVPYEELPGILQRLHVALRPEGIFYASFKYGTGMRQVEERTFFDMDEKKILPFLEGLFSPLEIWKREDTRSVAPSPDKCWLHIIARRA